jgi:putative ABC transport system substrate-binding protein
MRRRELITLVGGAAATWPLIAYAQQPERMRRIGAFAGIEDDAEGQARFAAFLQGLRQLGWTDGRNVRIDYRWGGGNADNIRKYAAELASLAPDVILAAGAAAVGPLLQATRTVPVVFVIVPDPVGAGFVDSLARPGGNATGFITFEYSISTKWLELLKQIAPGVTRAAVLRDPAISTGIGQWGAIEAVAPSLGMEVIPVNVRDAGEIERAVAVFARPSNGGLIVTASALVVVHRDFHALPAIYQFREFAAAGRPHELRHRSGGNVLPERRLRRPLAQRREGRRFARATGHESRINHQSQGCQGARPQRAAVAARPRRRADRMSSRIRGKNADVACWPIGEVAVRDSDARFRG